MKYLLKLFGIVFPALIWVSCIVPYEPEELVNLDDIIVVEGNISLTGPFSIRITRSAPISTYQYGQRTIKIERNARVFVRDSKGQTYKADTVTAYGEYLFDFSGLRPSLEEEYQLVIESQDGQTYETDFRKSRHSSDMELDYIIDTLEQKFAYSSVHMMMPGCPSIITGTTRKHGITCHRCRHTVILTSPKLRKQ